MSNIAPIMVEEMQIPWKHGQVFHPYSIQKEKQISKRFYTKSRALFKNHDNFRSIFIYKKQDTLRYTIFHEIFEVGVYTQKAGHCALRDIFIYKTPDTSQKSRQFMLRFYIQKSGHFALRNSSLNFWNLRRGGGGL